MSYKRNYSYDSLRQSLRELSEAIPATNNVLLKGADPSLDVFQRYHDLNKEKELAGEAIYKQFTDLRDDYAAGNINLKRYTEHLKYYKEFFGSNVQLQDLPKSLPAEEILTEIQKYIG